MSRGSEPHGRSARQPDVRVTAEALTWEAICTAIKKDCWTVAVREVAGDIGRSASAVAMTHAWRYYQSLRRRARQEKVGRQGNSPRQRNVRVTAEGLTWEVIRAAIKKDDWILTVREIAGKIGRSAPAVAMTLAWRRYRSLRREARQKEMARREAARRAREKRELRWIHLVDFRDA